MDWLAELCRPEEPEQKEEFDFPEAPYKLESLHEKIAEAIEMGTELAHEHGPSLIDKAEEEEDLKKAVADLSDEDAVKIAEAMEKGALGSMGKWMLGGAAGGGLLNVARGGEGSPLKRFATGAAVGAGAGAGAKAIGSRIGAARAGKMHFPDKSPIGLAAPPIPALEVQASAEKIAVWGALKGLAGKALSSGVGKKMVGMAARNPLIATTLGGAAVGGMASKATGGDFTSGAFGGGLMGAAGGALAGRQAVRRGIGKLYGGAVRHYRAGIPAARARMGGLQGPLRQTGKFAGVILTTPPRATAKGVTLGTRTSHPTRQAAMQHASAMAQKLASENKEKIASAKSAGLASGLKKMIGAGAKKPTSVVPSRANPVVPAKKPEFPAAWTQRQGARPPKVTRMGPGGETLPMIHGRGVGAPTRLPGLAGQPAPRMKPPVPGAPPVRGRAVGQAMGGGGIRKIALGDKEKIAYVTECGGDGNWLSQFEGTPLLERAIEIETQLLETEKQDLERRIQERANRPPMESQNELWDMQDRMRLEKKMLELQLVAERNSQGVSDTYEASEEEAPAEEVPAEQNVAGVPTEGIAAAQGVEKQGAWKQVPKKFLPPVMRGKKKVLQGRPPGVPFTKKATGGAACRQMRMELAKDRTPPKKRWKEACLPPRG